MAAAASNFQVIVTSHDGTQRRRLPARNIGIPTWAIERFGGYAEFTLPTTLPFLAGTNILIDDRVEYWSQGVRLYRGYVTAITPSNEDPPKLLFAGYGVSKSVRELPSLRDYAFPGGAYPLNLAWAKVTQDVLNAAAGPGGLPLVTTLDAEDIGPGGPTIASLAARNKIFGDVIDNLMTSAANLSIWGGDVGPDNGDRLYFRGIQAAAPPTHVIPVPSRRVEKSVSERQAGDIINQVLISGGAPQWPQYLFNGNFEEPVWQQEGSGNLVKNGDFEENTIWSYGGSGLGARRRQAFYQFSGPINAVPFSGGWFLDLQEVGGTATATYAQALVAGNTYVLSAQAARETDANAASGTVTLTLLDSGGGTIQTVTMAIAPPGNAYSYYQASFLAPAGVASITIEAECLAQGTTSLIVDDIELYDVSVLYQAGWGLTLADAVHNTIYAQNYAYDLSPWDGATCVYLDLGCPDSNNHDIKLEPLASSRFKVTAAQEFVFSGWFNSPPASTNPNIPKFRMEMRFYDSSGNLIQHTGYPSLTFTPGDAATGLNPAIPATVFTGWIQLQMTCSAPSGAVSADANITWRGTGSLLIDGLSVQDQTQPPPATPAQYVVSGNVSYFIRASDAGLADYRTANGLSNPAPYVDSETTFGWHCTNVSNENIITLADGYAVADVLFSASALPIYRPKTSLLGDVGPYWPGETVSLQGALGPIICPETLPIVRIRGMYDGIVRLGIEQERESADEMLAIQKIILRQIQSLGPGASSVSGASSPSNNGGGVGVTSSGTGLFVKDVITPGASYGPFTLSFTPNGRFSMLWWDVGVGADTDVSVTADQLTIAGGVDLTQIVTLTYFYSCDATEV